jgi:hypothetical protein
MDFFFSNAWDGTQGLVYARQALYFSVISPAIHIILELPHWLNAHQRRLTVGAQGSFPGNGGKTHSPGQRSPFPLPSILGASCHWRGPGGTVDIAWQQGPDKQQQHHRFPRQPFGNKQDSDRHLPQQEKGRSCPAQPECWSIAQPQGGKWGAICPQKDSCPSARTQSVQGWGLSFCPNRHPFHPGFGESSSEVQRRVAHSSSLCPAVGGQIHPGWEPG